MRADGTPIELSLRPEQNMFELGPNDYFGYVNQEPFELSFYFFDVLSETITLNLTVEGRAAIELINVSAHAAPDLVLREFDHGLVLANPDPSASHTVDLEQLFPGLKLRKISGSDPVNDGSRVGRTITLPARDAMILRKR